MIILADDDLDKIEDLILNIAIEDLMEDMESQTPTWYREVMDFLQKVILFI